MADTTQGQLYVVRHGETEWSVAGKHTGLTDLDLTDAGVAEARVLGGALAGRSFAEIRVSPLQRARRTADIAGLVPAVVDPDLVEWDYGGYEGLTTIEIRDRATPDWTVWTGGVTPGRTPGETVEQVGDRQDRVLAAVRPALARGDVALVAHAHSLRVLTARWLGLPPASGALLRLNTATYGVLGYEHQRPVVMRWSVR